MAIIYTWTIPNCEHDIASGGINVIHWNCTGVDDGFSTSSYGAVNLTPDPSSPDFVAYNDVTEAMAQSWVWDSVSQNDTEASVATEIDAMENPTEAYGKPWAA